MNGNDLFFVNFGPNVVAVLTVIVLGSLRIENTVTLAGTAAGGVTGALTTMFVKWMKAAGTARADG